MSEWPIARLPRRRGHCTSLSQMLKHLLILHLQVRVRPIGLVRDHVQLLVLFVDLFADAQRQILQSTYARLHVFEMVV